MRRDGFTLIEVLTASTLLIAALGMIWQAWMMANTTTDVLGRKLDATNASMGAMGIMEQELRLASFAQLSPLPAATIRYRIPEDADGDGLPVDASGKPEYGAERIITRDLEDANHDGISERQLVLIAGERVEVLANDLLPDESEDTNGNGRVDRGIWFEAEGRGVMVHLNVSMKSARKLSLPGQAAQLVTPRNP